MSLEVLDARVRSAAVLAPRQHQQLVKQRHLGHQPLQQKTGPG